MVALTPNAVRAMCSMSRSNDNPSFTPAVQVIHLKKIERRPNHVSFTGIEERWKIVLSDGEASVNALLSRELNNFIKSRVIATNAVIRITSFSVNNLSSGQQIINLSGVEYVGPNPGYRVGDPVDIHTHERINDDGGRDFSGVGITSSCSIGQTSSTTSASSRGNLHANSNPTPPLQSCSSSSSVSNEVCYTVDAAKQRVSVVERWKQSTMKSLENAGKSYDDALALLEHAKKVVQNAERGLNAAQAEHILASKEVENARSCLDQMELTRGHAGDER